jgi:membrane protein
MSHTSHPITAADGSRERIRSGGATQATARHMRSRGDPHPDADRRPPHPPGEGQLPGVTAEKATDIPMRGWKQIVERAWAENKADNMPIIAAGVAFFGFLSIFPALIALISIYGLVASPDEAAQEVQSLTNGLPEGAQGLISDQLTSITGNTGGALTFGLIVSLLAALWTASGGVNNLVKGVNIAYDEDETRGFLKLRGLSVLLTLGALVSVLLAFGLLALAPLVLDALALGGVGTVLVQLLRWALLLVVVAGFLAVVYRLAPDRAAPQFRWVSLGSVVVTVAWVLVSLAFNFYVSNFGSYNETYGAIAGVIVLMLWLYLTCFLVLLGAEINSEAEHQTARDTTEGRPKPMGQRNARMADEFPEPAHIHDSSPATRDTA